MIFCHRWKPRFRSAAARGWQPRHLLAEDAERHAAGRRALLCEEPFARRICLRPRLGRGLRARRRRLLPQAAGGGAVHAGDRPSPAGPPRPAGRRRARRARRRARRDHHGQRAVLGARHLPDRAGMARARRARLPAAHRPAIPLGECRLRQLRRFPRPRWPRASARPSAASARRRWRPASRSPGSPAPTSPKRCGTPSSPSTWTPARANGAGPI